MIVNDYLPFIYSQDLQLSINDVEIVGGVGLNLISGRGPKAYKIILEEKDQAHLCE